MVYGYCRISTKQQSIERQIRNILGAYPDVRIMQEAYSGRTLNRPEWQKLMQRVRAGDTIVFDSVSRMSRDADEGFRTYKELYDAGVALVFLKERHIDTAAYQDAMGAVMPEIKASGDDVTDDFIRAIVDAVNRFMLAKARADIYKAFEQSQKEVDDLRQRTKEGMETARRNGKQIGQVPQSTLTTKKSIAAKAIIRQHNRDFGGSLNDADTIKLCGISRNTFYAYKRQIRSELAADG